MYRNTLWFDQFCLSFTSMIADGLKCVLFADNVITFCLKRNLTELKATLNRELRDLIVWLSANKLSLKLFTSMLIT